MTHEQGEGIRDAMDSIARALRDLGNGNAATHMGGLEAHGLAVKDAADKIEHGLGEVAEAIRYLGDCVARIPEEMP